MERKDEAVVCVSCNGSGCHQITVDPGDQYKAFNGRKRRNGVAKIRFGSGMILDDTSRARWFTYSEFKEKVPEKYVKKD
jgi:hypothetical protein